MTVEQIKRDLKKMANPKKVKILSSFFKTKKGEYGEGDKFIGITVPNQRIVAKSHKALPLSDVKKLLSNRIHEFRLTGLLILTYKFPKATEQEKKEIIDLYLKNTNYVNNWDLVDLSAPKLLGQYLLDNPEYKKILYKLAKSSLLWDRRIAMLATYTLIKAKNFTDALKLAKILLNDKHDLMHKAVGWMLREIGKLDQKTETNFLDKHSKQMPRTMLRYAIERLPEKKRKFYLTN